MRCGAKGGYSSCLSVLLQLQLLELGDDMNDVLLKSTFDIREDSNSILYVVAPDVTHSHSMIGSNIAQIVSLSVFVS